MRHRRLDLWSVSGGEQDHVDRAGRRVRTGRVLLDHAVRSDDLGAEIIGQGGDETPTQFRLGVVDHDPAQRLRFHVRL